MPSGDAQRTWFPEMIATLRRQWNPLMDLPELIALCDRLDGMLQSIRSSRDILPPIIRCPRCGHTERSPQPRVSVRAMLLALSRFGIAPADKVKMLERRWAKYRRERQLDFYGKLETTKSSHDHPGHQTGHN